MQKKTRDCELMNAIDNVMSVQALAQYSVQQEASYSLLKKVLDMQQASVSRLLEAMPTPPVTAGAAKGGNLNAYA